MKSVIIPGTSSKKSKRDPAEQKDFKVTLSQEEITELSDYLRLSNHQKNLLNSLNIGSSKNIIRRKLSVLKKQINKSGNTKVLDISKDTWRWTTLSKSRRRKFERQVKKVINQIDPNPTPKEARTTIAKNKFIGESLWSKILKMPISDEQKWIDMNNSLLQDKAPFPNTIIIQTPYHAWKRIQVHDFKTFIKHQNQLAEWFEK